MRRFLYPLFLLFLFPGCYRDNAPTQPLPVTHVGQKVVVSDFAGSMETYVDWQGRRVGGFYDFSGFDSLVVTFHAGTVSGGGSPVPLSLKIGPSYYANGVVSDPDQGFEYHVLVTQLAKPQSAALTFIVQDTLSSVLLSNFVVVGWYTY